MDVGSGARNVVVLLRRRWVLDTLDALRDGPICPHAPPARLEPVSDKVLTTVLRALEAKRTVARVVEHGGPPRASYRLTDRGQFVGRWLDGLRPPAIE